MLKLWGLPIVISSFITFLITLSFQVPHLPVIEKNNKPPFITCINSHHHPSFTIVEEKLQFFDSQILFQPKPSPLLTLELPYILDTAPMPSIEYHPYILDDVCTSPTLYNDNATLKSLYATFGLQSLPLKKTTEYRVHRLLMPMNCPLTPLIIQKAPTPAPLNYALWPPAAYILQYAHSFLIGPPIPISNSLSSEINATLNQMAIQTLPPDANGYYHLTITP
jgi:hypothetical protein